MPRRSVFFSANRHPDERSEEGTASQPAPPWFFYATTVIPTKEGSACLLHCVILRSAAPKDLFASSPLLEPSGLPVGLRTHRYC
jgi:hypothetical protein